MMRHTADGVCYCGKIHNCAEADELRLAEVEQLQDALEQQVADLRAMVNVHEGELRGIAARRKGSR